MLKDGDDSKVERWWKNPEASNVDRFVYCCIFEGVGLLPK